MAFHELATNASKYGALRQDGAQLKVSWRTVPGEQADDVVVVWRETGVPLENPPTRRGFGAETIERSLPYMLGGDSRVEFHSDGVECTIRFPLGARPFPTPMRARIDAVQTSLKGRRILVVEDEFLIAMEVEDVLRALGAEVVGPFGRLEPALERCIGKTSTARFSTSGSMVTRSSRWPLCWFLRGLPVLLTTGYESEQLPPDLRHLPRLRKPFDERDLRHMLEQAYR